MCVLRHIYRIGPWIFLHSKATMYIYYMCTPYCCSTHAGVDRPTLFMLWYVVLSSMMHSCICLEQILLSAKAMFTIAVFYSVVNICCIPPETIFLVAVHKKQKCVTINYYWHLLICNLKKNVVGKLK